VKLFQDAGLDKEKFLKLVELSEERKEEVKLRCFAGFATEERLRTEFKVPQTKINAIKAYCEKREGYVKHDRYDSQPTYWYEGEVQAEWEKTTSRTRRETSEFQVETNVGEAMLEAVAPVNLDVSSLGTAGFPVTGNNNKPIKAAPAAPTGLPPVLKSENASDVILKYLDGILKRNQKMTDLKAKYEEIPAADRNPPQAALITKIDEKISELDGIHTKINDVYSCGAVEGYSEEQEKTLLGLYKTAMKASSDAMAVEMRAKSIPLPKAKAVPKTKAKAKSAPKPVEAAEGKAKAKPAAKRAAKK